jgi:predicted kinase
MQSPRKILIQMSGAPGSGKSTLANLLAQSMNGIVVNHDLIKFFFLENGILFEQTAKLAHDFQWTLAKDMIKQGQATIIVDSTCNYQATLDQGAALARLYNYEYAYVECKVDNIDLLETRLRSRVPMRSQRASVTSTPIDARKARPSEDYRILFKKWFDNPFRPASNAIIVDSSTNSPEECLEYTLKRIAPKVVVPPS